MSIWGHASPADDVDALRAGLVEVLVRAVLDELFRARIGLELELPARDVELERALGELGGAFMLFELALSNGLPRGQA